MKFSGLVKDASKGRALAGARVVLSSEGRELAVMYSDGAGKVEYGEERTYRGKHLVCRVEKEGFATREEDFLIEEEDFSREITLVPTGDKTRAKGKDEE